MGHLSHDVPKGKPKGYSQSKAKDLIMNAIISLSPTIETLINEYGAVHAEITRLTKIKDQLSKDIKANGAGTYKTAIYKGLVYSVSGKESIDWESIALKFNPSHQLITAHTKHGEPSLSLKVTKV
jgi:hypothetical protein